MLRKVLRRLADRRSYYFYAQRGILNVDLRKKLASAEARFYPRADSLADQRLVQQLEERGYTDTFYLVPDARVRALRERISDLPLYDPYRVHSEFTLKNVPSDTHVAYVREEALARVPGVLDAANNQDVLAVVGQVFGCKPTLDCVLSWWSMPGHETPEQAQSFHRDVDSLNFLKLFMYLTDVGDTAGPHVYVSGSHKENVPGEKIRRYTDSEMSALYRENRVVRFTGDAGACFLENTFGYHKGAVPKTTRRLILQFVYAVHPTPYGPKKPFLTLNGFDPYVNRLFER
jgi:hypothetical protein